MVHNKIIELEEVSLDVELPDILFTHAKDHIESVLCACNHEVCLNILISNCIIII